MHGEPRLSASAPGSAGTVLAARPVAWITNSRYARAIQEWAMRWHDGNPSWASERFGLFDPDDYGVDLIDRKTAVGFITRHHYSRSVPELRRYRFGLYHLVGEQPLLCGVAALSVPPSAAVLKGPFPGLEPIHESAELGRMVLLDVVPHGAERSQRSAGRWPGT